jgi:diguanylate cyclase (GGDEF)-like protein
LLVLPIAADLVIVMLRQAQGGSTSGYAPLAILPVAWVGLTQSRRAVAAMTVCTTLMFGLPIAIIGDPLYPATGWRSVVLWTVVTLVVGIGANRVVAKQQAQAALSQARAAALDRLVRTQTAMATHEVDLEGLTKAAADGALALTGADAARVELLDGDEVVCVGAAGAAAGVVGLRLKADAAVGRECLRTGEVIACGDSELDPRIDSLACRALGARSLIAVPVVLDDEVKGLLWVYAATGETFHGDETQLLALLANMLGAALARAELLEKLISQAVTDELTGLPNRRSLYQELDHALARASRTDQPLSVLVLDLDNLKQVNDEGGHVAGDRLLKSVASIWAGELRETDVIGRIGGDEFAVILELSDADTALEVVARLDQSLQGPHRASTGIAVWDGDEDGTTLVARADANMYAHKKARAAR